MAKLGDLAAVLGERGLSEEDKENRALEIQLEENLKGGKMKSRMCTGVECIGVSTTLNCITKTSLLWKKATIYSVDVVLYGVSESLFWFQFLNSELRKRSV